MIEIISLGLNLVLGSGLVLFYSSQRRKQAAEASSAEIGVRSGEFEIHRQSVEFLSKQLNEAYHEIDKMQDIINEKRDAIIGLIRLSKQLEINVIEEASRRQKLMVQVCVNADCLLRIKNESGVVD